MLKKVVSAILILAGAALLGIFLLCCMRNIAARKTLVPPEATAFLAVHTDGLYQKLAIDRLFSQRNGSRRTWRKSGLQIPARIYFYRLGSNWFTLLHCTDTLTFDKEIKQPATWKGWADNKAGARTFRWVRHGSRVALVLWPDANAERQALGLLQRGNLKPISGSMLGRLDGADLAYADQAATVKINTADGLITADAWFSGKNMAPKKSSRHRKFSAGSALRFWLEADLSGHIPETLRLANRSFDMRPLRQAMPTNIDAEWSGVVLQRQAEIRYTFNDNFEKVAETLAVNKNVPAFWITTAAAPGKTNGLGALLKMNQLVEKNGSIHEQLFPLFSLRFLEKGPIAGAGTAPELFARPRTQASAAFAGLDIDFTRLQGLDASWRQSLAALKTLRVRAFAHRDTWRVHAVLRFTEPSTNPLSRFF
ncbi:hypothetical protein C7T94_17975 [Pedobacter yulinensis]|uniref:Uncharacterized protein n=1 Tax=Pedobacter yulinensis TaxID=2126353 RepID=A0A2T3HH48_9SPHI|nr:hypothetical protein [Pedobacter yulinensis]PST81759.1 hypothetical protein C7T94_17975 [Pedobacter yulinensis]